jgi:integrase/recombinase XerD
MARNIFKSRMFEFRHRRAPMLAGRLKFLSHLKGQGYGESTLHQRAAVLVTITEVFDSAQPRTHADVRSRLSEAIPPRKHKDKVDAAFESLVRLAVEWFEFLGKIPPLNNEPELASSHQAALDRYIDFLKAERESSPATILNYKKATISFLLWLEGQGLSLEALTSEDVDEFVKHRASQLSRRSMPTAISTLKLFLSFCERKKMCREKLACILQQPPVFKYETLPRGPSWDLVQKLISTPDLKTQYGIRDRAILLLLAVYGLRSSEVATLKLDDIDWVNKTVGVTRAKTGGRQTIYPLVDDVAEAIIGYLEKARPKTHFREVFLNIKAPLEPIQPACCSAITKKYYKLAGIQPPTWGAHSLRHACATNLMHQQLSLKEIAEHLGHESLSSTRIYAKVDLHGLRQVGDFDMGGLT